MGIKAIKLATFYAFSSTFSPNKTDHRVVKLANLVGSFFSFASNNESKIVLNDFSVSLYFSLISFLCLKPLTFNIFL